MTIEEKLEHFQTLCFQDASERSEKMLKDYTESLRKTLEEHKQDAKRQAEMQIAGSLEEIKREINKKLSLEQINIKRRYSEKQEEYKAMLFNELRDKLAHFMSLPEYQAMLEHQVEKAAEFAGDAPITIFFDPSDADKVNRIALHTGADIQISEQSFLGGLQAKIPSKNILIDNSFKTKLEEAEANFQFRLGGR